jgi:hypothetical protein
MTKVCDALRDTCVLGRLTLKAADHFIMHVFSRASGPRDVLNILEGSHPPSLSFHRAFRITYTRSKAYSS